MSSSTKETFYYPMLFAGSAGVGEYCSLFFENKWTKFGVIFVFTILTYIAIGTNIRDLLGRNDKELLIYLAAYGSLCLIFDGIGSIVNWSKDESKKA